MPASEALRARTSFDYFICNIPVVTCKLDLVFCFYQIVNRQLKQTNKTKRSPWQELELQLLRPYRQVIYVRELLATLLRLRAKKLIYCESHVGILKGIRVNRAINRMIFPAIASLYHMIFSFTCQFSQRPDFHVIFDGDGPSTPVADTNIWLMPNKGDVLSRVIVPESAWNSNLIGLFRIEIHVLSCHTENTAPAASFKIPPPPLPVKISRPPFGRRMIQRQWSRFTDF